MTSRPIRISPDLLLPIEAVTEAIGFLGRRGSGKSYAAMVMAEQFHKISAQFIALDPVGVWWSLRLAADGKSPGLPIPVFGGLQGDVPLEPTAGRIVADTIVDRGISAVIDVSQFESDADKARFARAFCERFYFRKKSAPSAVHVFLEEAQEFIPQNPTKDEPLMLHAFTRLAKLGRNFGIGLSMLSQRPQEVNKKVLNLAELLFVFQLTGVHERKSVESWIGDKGIEGEDIEAELPKLERGHPHVWSPAWLKTSRVIEIGHKTTFDASSTPKVGAAATSVRELSPIDLEKLRADMAATIERAKADDPKELRKEIATLKKQLATAPAKTVERTISVVDQRAIERAVRDAIAPFTSRFAHIRRAVGNVTRAAMPLADALAGLEAINFDVEGPRANGNGHAEQKRQYVPPAAPAARVTQRAISRTATGAGDASLGKGERIVLTTIAQYPDGADREQLTVLTGYKRSSRDTYIQRLQAAGLIEVRGGLVVATDAGVDALGADFEPLPTGEGLQRYWLDRLGGGEREILRLLIEADGEAVPRDDLGEAIGYKRSSRDTYLRRLAARKLVEVVGPGEVRASPILFDEAGL